MTADHRSPNYSRKLSSPDVSFPLRGKKRGRSDATIAYYEETASALYHRMVDMCDDPMSEVEQQIERAEFFSTNVSHSCDLEVWEWVRKKLLADRQQ